MAHRVAAATAPEKIEVGAVVVGAVIGEAVPVGGAGALGCFRAVRSKRSAVMPVRSLRATRSSENLVAFSGERPARVHQAPSSSSAKRVEGLGGS